MSAGYNFCCIYVSLMKVSLIESFELIKSLKSLVQSFICPYLLNIYSAFIFCLSDAVVGSTKSNTICPGKF